MRLLCTCFLFLSFFGFSNENLYEISLKEKVTNSSIIVEGEITNKESFWNAAHTMIFTRNTVEVYSVFKGNFKKHKLVIITDGGLVGNDGISTSSLLSLDNHQYGMFFLKKHPLYPSQFTVYSSTQGFIEYSRDGTRAFSPFYEVSRADHRRAVLELLNKKKELIRQDHAYVTPVKSLTILQFSPQNITAGTQSVLTITGTDFGTSGPSSANYVEFSDPNTGGGGNYFQPVPGDYVSWTNTQIKVRVPTRAGSGIFHVVINGATSSSSTPLIVNYALLTTAGADTSYRLRVVNDNTSGGYSWTFNSGIGSTARASFNRALDEWRCLSGINWVTNVSSTTVNSAVAGDGINLVSLNSGLPAGVLGVCYNYFSSCNGYDWQVYEQDILFSFASWNYSIGLPAALQMDFQSVAFHELGHAHLLGHVNTANDVMFYAIGSGQTRRDATLFNTMASNQVMDLSTAVTFCSMPPMIPFFPTGCAPLSITDVALLPSPLNPADSLCLGNHLFYVSISNTATDTINSVQLAWSVNGVLQPAITWSGILAGGQIQSNIPLGTATITSTENEIRVWAELVNGGIEINTFNDTIAFDFHPISCTNDNAGISLIEPYSETTCPGATDDVIVSLTNHGQNNLTSCTLYFRLNGILTDSLLWTGNIAPGQTQQGIQLATTSFYQGSYVVEAWTGSPNGQPDTYTANDSTAYVYTPLFCPHSDIGITGMPEFTPESCPGNYAFPVCLTNFGIDVLNSCTIVAIVNGTEEISYNWTGTLAPDSAAICNINIGTLGLSHLQNAIRVYAKLPNGTADERHANDTLTQLFNPLRLNGTYTIGGTAPDFATPDLAAGYLNTMGICGDVTFTIRTGNYSGSLLLDTIPSYNGDHTVIFQSESGNADSVVLNRLISPYYYYNTVLIDGTQNLVFRNLTFVNSPTGSEPEYAATTILLKGAAKNIRFENNKITNYNSHPDVAVYCVDIQAGGANSSIGHYQFDGNTFYNGKYGINCNPLSGSVHGIAVVNNQFDHQASDNVHIINSDNVTVQNNSFHSTTYGSGLFIHDVSDTLRILGNEFYHSTDEEALEVSNSNGTSSNHSLIANNVFHHSYATQFYNYGTVSINECGYLDFVHNTIQHDYSGGASSTVINFGTGLAHLRVINNLITRTGPGYIYNCTEIPGTMNYNDLVYASGTFALVNGTPVNSLAAFQASQLRELNSVSINPGFVGNVLWPHNAALNNLGTPLTIVPSDKIGVLRSTTTPDMGAYEFTKHNLDAGVSAMDLNQGHFCNHEAAVYIDISNYGIQSLTGFSIQVQVNDSLYAPQVFTQPIAPDNTLSDLYVGSFPILSAGANTILVRTLLPNGSADQDAVNDALAAETIYSALNGIYTAGTPGSDFPMIQDAVSYLNTYGVCGPTVINIASGVYMGHYVLYDIPGTSAVNTVTIQSAAQDTAAVTLQWQHDYQSFDGHILRLNKTHNVLLQYLTFDPLGSSFNGNLDRALVLGSAQNIVIRNCHFIEADINGASADMYDPPMIRLRDITIQNNRFEDGRIEFHVANVIAIDSNIFEKGEIQLQYADTLLISGNDIDRFSTQSFELVWILNSSNIQLVRNKFLHGTVLLQFCTTTPNMPESSLIANNFFATPSSFNQHPVTLAVMNSPDLRSFITTFTTMATRFLSMAQWIESPITFSVR